LIKTVGCIIAYVTVITSLDIPIGIIHFSIFIALFGIFIFFFLNPCNAVFTVPFLYGIQFFLCLEVQIGGALGVQPPLVRAFLVAVAPDEEVASQ